MAHRAHIGARIVVRIAWTRPRPNIQQRLHEDDESRGYAETRRARGRDNLLQKAFEEFVLWFLCVCFYQIRFMTDLFALESLRRRLRQYVGQNASLRPEAASLLSEAPVRGQFDRGEATRITGLPERTARRVLHDVVVGGL